jgi:hypothetical protein
MQSSRVLARTCPNLLLPTRSGSPRRAGPSLAGWGSPQSLFLRFSRSEKQYTWGPLATRWQAITDCRAQ